MAVPTNEQLKIALPRQSPSRRLTPTGVDVFGATFPITAAALNRVAADTESGKSIQEICAFGYWQLRGDADFKYDNHCAHFVSHVLGFAAPPKKDCATRAAGKAFDRYREASDKWRAGGGSGSGRPKPLYEKLYTQEGASARTNGVCFEVMELFQLCKAVGPIDEWPQASSDESRGLVFFGTGGTAGTLRPAGQTWSMGNGDRKHVGIYIGQDVWHFSNSRGRAVRQPIDDMRSIYGKETVVVRAKSLPARTWAPPV